MTCTRMSPTPHQDRACLWPWKVPSPPVSCPLPSTAALRLVPAVGVACSGLGDKWIVRVSSRVLSGWYRCDICGDVLTRVSGSHNFLMLRSGPVHVCVATDCVPIVVSFGESARSLPGNKSLLVICVGCGSREAARLCPELMLAAGLLGYQNQP